MKRLDKDFLDNLTNNVKIKYEDNHILVAYKPHNLLTQKNGFSNINLEDILKKYLKDKYLKKGNVFLHAIHRLDKDTEGLVLFAKTSKALSRLNKEMREKKIIKKYLAKVEGLLIEKKKKVNFFISHESHKAKVSFKNFEGAKKASLFYEIIKKEKINSFDVTSLKIELITGRYHQIRAFFAYIGHPIIGDKKYGSNISCENVFLSSTFLKFTHPISQKEMFFSL